jgi:hypothetical protein
LFNKDIATHISGDAAFDLHFAALFFQHAIFDPVVSNKSNHLL